MNWRQRFRWRIALYRYRLKGIVRRTEFWIADWKPTQCARCKGWRRRKNTEPVRSTTGALVYLCKKCHKEVFSPLGAKET